MDRREVAKEFYRKGTNKFKRLCNKDPSRCAVDFLFGVVLLEAKKNPHAINVRILLKGLAII